MIFQKAIEYDVEKRCEAVEWLVLLDKLQIQLPIICVGLKCSSSWLEPKVTMHPRVLTTSIGRQNHGFFPIKFSFSILLIIFLVEIPIILLLTK